MLHESLSTQRYHMGLTEELTAPPGTTIETLLTLDVVCVLPTDHALCRRSDKVLTPQDFAGQDFVYLAEVDPYRQQVDSLFSELGIERRMVVETLSAGAVCETVSLGMGIAIVNPLTALSYARSGLQIRRFSHAIPYSVNLAQPMFRPESSVVAGFVGVLKSTCQRIEAELFAITG